MCLENALKYAKAGYWMPMTNLCINFSAKVPLTNPYKCTHTHSLIHTLAHTWKDECNGTARRLGVCFMNSAYKVQSMNRGGENGWGGPSLRLAWALTISTPALIIIKGAFSKERSLSDNVNVLWAALAQLLMIYLRKFTREQF